MGGSGGWKGQPYQAQGRYPNGYGSAGLAGVTLLLLRDEE